LLLASIFPAQLWADGNELLKQCVAAEKVLEGGDLRVPLDVGLCLGMVIGVRDTMSIMTLNNEKIKVCFPKGGITNGQSIRIVSHYLKNNLSELHENEILLAMQAYPCK